MPFENAQTISELNPLYPLGSDPIGEGDNHIRQLKTVLKHFHDVEFFESLSLLYTNAGYELVSGSFEAGGTVSTVTQVLLYEAEGRTYAWEGVLPKVVPVGSTPAGTGGVAPGAWRLINKVSLRDDLASFDSGLGSTLVQGVSDQFDNLQQALDATFLESGRKLEVGGYNINSDGGHATFEVVNTADPVGILSTNGLFKLKRMSGHDYFATLCKTGSSPKIIAHRGWHGTTPGEFPGSGLATPIYFVPENTRASIRFAAERGAWGVEGDTKISSDGVPVVIHDDTMARTTNNVNTGAVTSYTYAQLKAMDVGTYVSSSWANERIMSYDEWLSECKRCAVLPFAEWSYPMSNTQADDFLALVKKYYGAKPTDVYVQSTNMDTLRLLRSKNAYISLCVMGSYGSALSAEILDTAYELGNCAAMLTGASITNSTAVDDVKSRGLLLVYAIANTQARIDSAINAGADIIVTDFYRG